MVSERRVRFGIAGGALFSALLVVVNVPTLWGVALLLSLTWAFSVGLGHRLACGLGCAGWALSDGFALNRLGSLTFTPVAVVLFAVFALSAWAVGRE